MNFISFISFLEQDILTTPNQTSINSTSSLPESTPQNKYTWLLILDLIIFISLTVTTYNSSKKLKESEQFNPDDFRAKFLQWLVVANGVRSVSLIFILAFGNPNGNTATSWLNSILHVFPAFLFVSCYMYLATFLSNVYYDHIHYDNHIMKPALTMTVQGGYIILIILALITLLFKAYIAFFYISEFLMAMLYLVLGSIIIYFGSKVSSIFQEKAQNNYDSSNEMSNKLSKLSFSIGGLFLIKGLSGLLTAINAINPTKHPNVYDFFWFLILEIAPTVIYIWVGRQKEAPAETPRQSSVYEMEYRDDRMSSFRPDFQQ